jgi:drug/metabolite transporter (DMT)-like permease
MIPYAVLFGLAMAIIDVFALGITKYISVGALKPAFKWMILPMVVYAFQPWIFLNSLKFETLTIMNLTWDLMSDVLVTLLGLFYLKEKVSRNRLIGVAFAFISLAFMSGTFNQEEE